MSAAFVVDRRGYAMKRQRTNGASGDVTFEGPLVRPPPVVGEVYIEKLQAEFPGQSAQLIMSILESANNNMEEARMLLSNFGTTNNASSCGRNFCKRLRHEMNDGGDDEFEFQQTSSSNECFPHQRGGDGGPGELNGQQEACSVYSAGSGIFNQAVANAETASMLNGAEDVDGVRGRANPQTCGSAAAEVADVELGEVEAAMDQIVNVVISTRSREEAKQRLRPLMKEVLGRNNLLRRAVLAQANLVCASRVREKQQEEHCTYLRGELEKYKRSLEETQLQMNRAYSLMNLYINKSALVLRNQHDEDPDDDYPSMQDSWRNPRGGTDDDHCAR